MHTPDTHLLVLMVDDESVSTACNPDCDGSRQRLTNGSQHIQRGVPTSCHEIVGKMKLEVREPFEAVDAVEKVDTHPARPPSHE